MDSLETPHVASTFADSDATRREIQSLRLTLQISLGALVILAGSIGVYMFRQVDLLRRQADAASRQAQQLAHVYNSSFGPQAQGFEQRVQAFAASDSNFLARIARFYGPPTSTGATVLAPTPAPPPKP